MRHIDKEKWYDTAQICLNGHVVNERYYASPDENKEHCSQCGESTITKCPNCSHEIKGYLHLPNWAIFTHDPAPEYCEKCGKPFPWTLKRQSIENLEQTIKHVEKQMKQNKIKNFFASTLGWAYKEIRSIFVDVSSEAIKKIAEHK